MDNILYDPELNPVIFYDDTLTTLNAYHTKHFELFPFEKRGHPWLQKASFGQVWQTSDIIRLQFEGNVDPVIIELVNERGYSEITLPAIVGLPNKFYPGTFSFEVEMSLSGVPAGCYRLKRTMGSGDNQKVQYSGCQYVSDEDIEGTILIEYWNSRFHKDVIFETGIRYQLRIPGWIDYDKLTKPKRQESFRNQKYTNTILSSKSAKNFPVHFGDEFGLPSDITNIIEEIFSCDNVLIDGKPFCLADDSKFEYTEVEKYRSRGMSAVIEPGINRNSRVFTVSSDPNKKLAYGIVVDKKVFGDTSNQGSSNAVPVLSVV
jgi:hypothetical protein